MSQTLDQLRARYAASQIRPGLETWLLRLPQMIRAYGLGQTLAFLLAAEERKRDQAMQVFSALEAWLCGLPDDDHPMRVYHNADNLLGQLRSGNRAQYQAAQQEALALAFWLKRLAEQPKAVSEAEGGADAPAVP